MSKIEQALARIDGAVARLEQAVDGHVPEVDVRLIEERDRLTSEVAVLKTRAEEDARLRAEAASAVREALRDLRSAVDDGGRKGQANA